MSFVGFNIQLYFILFLVQVYQMDNPPISDLGMQHTLNPFISFV